MNAHLALDVVAESVLLVRSEFRPTKIIYRERESKIEHFSLSTLDPTAIRVSYTRILSKLFSYDTLASMLNQETFNDINKKSDMKGVINKS